MGWNEPSLAASALRTAVDGVAAVLLAPACAACRHPLASPTAGPVCPRCWASVVRVSPPVCLRCGDSLPSWRVMSVDLGICARCRRGPRAVDRARAGGEYEGALREIIHAFKYEGRASLAAPLAALARDAGHELLRDCACAVPVPLHPWRRLRRGFNQATQIARGLDLPVVHALWRVRATAPQLRLTAAERRRNVRNVFALSPWMRRPRMRARWLEDRVVLLVDDVRTTGATLEACATALKAAGVREVRALTVARAAPPRR